MKKRNKGLRDNRIDIGDMTERIEIQKQIDIEDEGGGRRTTWGSFDHPLLFWAKVESISNNWQVEMDMKRTEDFKNFVIHYNAIVNKEMRVFWHNKSYRIISINDFNAGDWFLRLECEGNKVND